MKFLLLGFHSKSVGIIFLFDWQSEFLCYLVIELSSKSSFFVSQLGSSIKYVRKIFRKTNISNTLIRTNTLEMLVYAENFVYLMDGPIFDTVSIHSVFKLFA